MNAAAIKAQIVEQERAVLQEINPEGKKAPCQSERMMFTDMRLAQYSLWPDTACVCYYEDLTRARAEGRNASEKPSRQQRRFMLRSIRNYAVCI